MTRERTLLYILRVEIRVLSGNYAEHSYALHKSGNN